MLPVMNSSSLGRQTKKKPCTIPHVKVARSSTPLSMLLALRAGLARHLTKRALFFFLGLHLLDLS